MVKFTERDLAIVAGLAGAADFLTEGRFSAPVARALKKVFSRSAPVAARGVASFVPRAVGTGRVIAMRHPYVAGAAVLYMGYKERDRIMDALAQGYEIVEPAVTAVKERVDPILEEAARLTTTAYPEGPGIRYPVTGPRFGAPRLPRKKSAFNRAVSAGMKAVKKTTSYGGKGKIKPATKVFAMVTKLASAKKKKKKAPKSGIRRKIWNAMKGLR